MTDTLVVAVSSDLLPSQSMVGVPSVERLSMDAIFCHACATLAASLPIKRSASNPCLMRSTVQFALFALRVIAKKSLLSRFICRRSTLVAMYRILVSIYSSLMGTTSL